MFKRPFRFFIFATALILFIIACRRQEEAPTAIPTAVAPAVLPTATNTPIPPEIDEETGEPLPTPLPAVRSINPDEINWPPQVIDSMPLPNEELLLDGAITIRFDQPMDQASVEGALLVANEADGTAVTGDFSWPKPDTVIFTPKNEMQGKQLLRVTIDEGAQGQNGRALEVPVAYFLQTAGSLAVSQTAPAGGTDGVATDGAITVIFNRPVVPLVGSAEQGQLPQPLTFDPPAAGRGEWTATSIYRFVPDPPLAGATTYQVSVDPTLTDVVGVPLEGDAGWSFTTLNPGVVTVSPEETQPIAPNTPFTVTFNMPMDHISTETAVSLSGGEEAVEELIFQWAEDGRVLSIRPGALLELETTYQLIIGPTAAAANGQATIGQQETFTYQTYPFPAVIGTYPRANNVAEYYDRGVNIQFASPMDWSTVENRISIFPPPANPQYYINEFANEVQIDFPLESDTRYSVIVPATAADPYGNTLPRAYELQFDTPSRPPIASFNLPRNQSLLSTSVANTVDIIHSNVAEMDVSLHDLGLPLNLLNRPYDVPEYNPAGSPLRTWNIPIESDRNEVGAFTLPLADGGTLPPGVYLLALNAPGVTVDAQWWQNQRNMIIVADTNVVVKEMFGDVYVWTTDIGSGQPVSGLNLTLYSEQGVQIGTAVTDGNGFGRIDYLPTNNYLEGVTVVSNAPGESGFGVGNSRWNNNASPWEFGLVADTSKEPDNSAYLYTDRPIYRPGDAVHFKGIVRRANYGRYDFTSTQELDLFIRFGNPYSGETFEDRLTVTVQPDGTFNGEYPLPTDAPLGNYSLLIETPSFNYTANRQFTVAEYRRPEFLVTLTPDTTEALRDEAVDVVLQAEYFFGGSAADLPVQWSAYEQSHFPEFPGPYYCWADCGGFNYDDGTLPFSFNSGFLDDGMGTTDENGRFTIKLPANMLAESDPGPRKVVVEATVQDLTGFPISSRAEITYHPAETYVGVKMVSNFIAAGETAVVDLKTVDWDGKRLSRQPVEVVFYRREWEPIRTRDFGTYYTVWNAIDTEVGRQRVTTDAMGEAQASFVPEQGGNYLAVATVTDDNGRDNFSSTPFWVTDDDRIGWQTDPRDSTMDLIPDQPEYAVGDQAKILVQNPFHVPVEAWVTIERGNLLTQQVVTLQPNSDILEIPVTLDYSPNAFVTVTAVKPVTPGAEDIYAEVRLGMTELIVPPAAFSLNVSLTPRETELAPGETAVYDILTTDASGNPTSADLSLALVDLAVLTLKEDNAPNILDFFYERQPYRSEIGGGLFISGEGLPLEIPVQAFGGGGGGGGDAAEAAPALRDGEEGDDGNVRRDFPDTAYWEANIQTDSDGRATVEIPLPDTLTTWRLHSKANTPDTQVGQNSADIRTTLPLLIRPVTPRFFTVGDLIQLGAVLNNNTANEIEAVASLEAEGVTINSPIEQTVTVPAHGQTLVRWETAVDDAQFVDGQAFADLTFRVAGGGFRDATKPGFGEGPDRLIPIVRYNAQDIVGTSGELGEAGRRVEAVLLPNAVNMDQGSIDVVLSPSLAAALLDSLVLHNNLESLPSCASSVADRLLPNTAVATLIRQNDVPEIETRYGEEVDTVIDSSISQLSQQVKDDGAWGWCFSAESNPWITAYALLGLTKARQIGYQVDERLLENAGNYLVDQLGIPASFRQPEEANRQAFFLYVLAELGVNVNGELDALFNDARGLLDPYAKALLILAYQLTGGSQENIDTLLSDLNGSAIVSATGAHWQDAEPDFNNLSSDIRGTAMVINALAQVDAENPLAATAVRWLMGARTASHWPTGHETAWSVFALSEWLTATGELNAAYDYGLQVNLQPVADGRFSRETIADSQQVSVPVPGLAEADPNYFEFRRGEGDGRFYYTLHMNTAVDASQVAASNQGIHVERAYYDADCDPEVETCDPIEQIEAGQRVRVVVTIQTDSDLLYPIIEDPLPAGGEAVDPNLDTTPSESGGIATPVDDMYGYWGWWYFNRVEYRDDKVVFLADFLPAGTYQYTYFLDAIIPGQYQVMPTFARQAYFPDVNGRGAGLLFTISE